MMATITQSLEEKSGTLLVKQMNKNLGLSAQENISREADTGTNCKPGARRGSTL